MLHNNVLLEVYPEIICSCIVEVKPKLSILWYICTSLTYCIWTHPCYNSSLSRIIQWMDGSWMDVGIVFFCVCHGIQELTHLMSAWGSCWGHALSLLCHADAWNLSYVPWHTLFRPYIIHSHVIPTSPFMQKKESDPSHWGSHPFLLSLSAVPLLYITSSLWCYLPQS